MNFGMVLYHGVARKPFAWKYRANKKPYSNLSIQPHGCAKPSLRNLQLPIHQERGPLPIHQERGHLFLLCQLSINDSSEQPFMCIEPRIAWSGFG